jgi:hypothetical protein
MRRQPISAVLASCIFISGCSSEIDKCVDAEVKAWEVKKSNFSKTNRPNMNVWDELNYSAIHSLDKSKEEVTAEVRLRCLRATSKPNGEIK